MTLTATSHSHPVPHWRVFDPVAPGSYIGVPKSWTGEKVREAIDCLFGKEIRLTWEEDAKIRAENRSLTVQLDAVQCCLKEEQEKARVQSRELSELRIRAARTGDEVPHTEWQKMRQDLDTLAKERDTYKAACARVNLNTDRIGSELEELRALKIQNAARITGLEFQLAYEKDDVKELRATVDTVREERNQALFASVPKMLQQAKEKGWKSPEDWHTLSKHGRQLEESLVRYAKNLTIVQAERDTYRIEYEKACGSLGRMPTRFATTAVSTEPQRWDTKPENTASKVPCKTMSFEPVFDAALTTLRDPEKVQRYTNEGLIANAIREAIQAYDRAK